MDWADRSPEALANWQRMMAAVNHMLREPDVILVNAQSVWDDLLPPGVYNSRPGWEEAWDRIANYAKIPSPKPVFRKMWLEAIESGQRFGALVLRNSVENDIEGFLSQVEIDPAAADLIREDQPATIASAVLFHEFDGSACYTGEAEYWLDASGRFLHSCRKYPKPDGFDEKAIEARIAHLKIHQGWILHTFARLNCHNVKLAPQKAGAGKPQKAGRQNRPATVWHEIAVEDIETRRTRDPAAPQDEKQELRFHRVRGHYADYTQGAGLFGKYKVRLWVQEHARGNPELGEVVASYKIKPGHAAGAKP
jgi:hypothetical protein